MDLSVEFMGLKLKNPIIVAAGPLTGSGELMKRAVDAGAGAVVTKTIVNEIRPNVRPRLYSVDQNMQNIELYSEFTLEEWERQIGYAKKHGAVVIANIMAHTPSEMSYIAKRVEQFGADAIELGISIPHGEGMEILVSDPKKLFELVASAVSKVNIPVMVKLSSNVANITKLAKAAEKAGASAISAIDTVRCIIGVDIEKGRTLLPTYGGYSGQAIRPIGLAAVASISQAVNIPVCGIGGVSSHEHVLEYMMLGASAVQMCTSLIMNGVDHISEVVQELESWMVNRGYVSFEQVRAKALTSLKSFEEIKVTPYISCVSKNCNKYECNKCATACIYNNIKKTDDKLTVNSNMCTGCGLCISVCPEHCFELVWK
jgi:dihydropyrimidine dehydrogenase (NAD+) subunit PreA